MTWLLSQGCLGLGPFLLARVKGLPCPPLLPLIVVALSSAPPLVLWYWVCGLEEGEGGRGRYHPPQGGRCSRRTTRKGGGDDEDAAESAGKRRQTGGGDSTEVEAAERLAQWVGLEEQFNKEAKERWRFPADAARITDERAGIEDRKHTSGGVFAAVDSNLGAVVGAEEGAIVSIPGKEGRIAQAWVNVRGGLRVFSVYFWHSEGWTPRNEALLEAVVKQAEVTRHPLLVACCVRKILRRPSGFKGI